MMKTLKFEKNIQVRKSDNSSPIRRIPCNKLIKKNFTLKKFTSLKDGLVVTLNWYSNKFYEKN